MKPRLVESEAGLAGRISVAAVERPGAEWDDHVRGNGDATFCHLGGWHRIISGVMGQEPIYLMARDEAGQTAGVLPLFLLRSRIFGRRLISVPFLNYGGPIGTPAAVAALLDAAVQQARRLRVRGMELRSRNAVESGVRAAKRKVAVLLPLPDEPDSLWDAFKPKLRSQIRRPMKEEMEVRFGPDQLGPFHAVFSRNMRDMGTPVLPARFFREMAEAFGDEMVVGAVYSQGAPVAAGAGFFFRQEFEMTWASSLREYNRSAPNMLLYWSVMDRVIRQGGRVFNFGRCTPGGGTHKFKLQWGGTDLPLPWLVWPETTERNDPSAGRLNRLAAAVWSRLPLAVADRAGPIVARQLPWW